MQKRIWQAQVIWFCGVRFWIAKFGSISEKLYERNHIYPVTIMSRNNSMSLALGKGYFIHRTLVREFKLRYVFLALL